jgi:hypothetical protein
MAAAQSHRTYREPGSPRKAAQAAGSKTAAPSAPLETPPNAASSAELSAAHTAKISLSISLTPYPRTLDMVGTVRFWTRFGKKMKKIAKKREKKQKKTSPRAWGGNFDSGSG